MSIKGTITLPLALIGTIAVSFITGSSAYFGTVNSQNEKVNEVKTEILGKIAESNKDIAVEKTRSDQLEKKMDRFENKLDELLKVNGLNPNKIQ